MAESIFLSRARWRGGASWWVVFRALRDHRGSNGDEDRDEDFAATVYGTAAYGGCFLAATTAAMGNIHGGECACWANIGDTDAGARDFMSERCCSKRCLRSVRISSRRCSSWRCHCALIDWAWLWIHSSIHSVIHSVVHSNSA